MGGPEPVGKIAPEATQESVKMKAFNPQGQKYSIRRQWLPWERKSSIGDIDSGGWNMPDLDFDLPDDELGLIIAIPFLILYSVLFALSLLLLLPFLIGLIFVIGELIMLTLLLPIVIPLRSLIWPWTIRVTDPNGLVMKHKVKGWLASRFYMRELKEQIEGGLAADFSEFAMGSNLADRPELEEFSRGNKSSLPPLRNDTDDEPLPPLPA